MSARRSTFRFVGAAPAATGLGLTALALPSSAAVTPTAVAASPHAGTGAAASQVPLHGQTPVVGLFRGKQIRYLDEGPVALAKGADGHYLSDVDPIWVVTNGASAQHNIIDNVPGLNQPDDYTPLWQVVTVTWKPGVRPLTLSSRHEVAVAQRNEWVTLKTTSTVVNCPVL